MGNPEMGAGSVLNQWENEGKRLTKWELCRVVKELRKFKRFKMALEVEDNVSVLFLVFFFWVHGYLVFFV